MDFKTNGLTKIVSGTSAWAKKQGPATKWARRTGPGQKWARKKGM
jgi:hypothetical protein